MHAVVSTAANVSDINQTPVLLHGQETELWADAGYVGVDKREALQTALANKEHTAALHAIWEAAKPPCSKRLVAPPRHWLAHYEIEVGTRLSRQTKRAINVISAATVDRLLAPTRTADRHRLPNPSRQFELCRDDELPV